VKDLPIEEYADTIGEAMIAGNLYGRYDMFNQMSEARVKSVDMAADDSVVVFEDIPTAYEEMLKFFFSKNVIKKKDFLKLDKKVRKYSFTVAKVGSEKMLDKIKKNLSDTLKGIDPFTGKKLDTSMLNLEDWMDTIDHYFNINGITNLSNWHLRIVFGVNVRTALNEGRMAILKEANPEEFPYIEFVAILDERTRPEHLELNEYRAPANDPIWQKITPPLDYGCRCGVRPVHVDEKLSATKKVPKLEGPGFKFVGKGQNIIKPLSEREKGLLEIAKIREQLAKKEKGYGKLKGNIADIKSNEQVQEVIEKEITELKRLYELDKTKYQYYAIRVDDQIQKTGYKLPNSKHLADGREFPKYGTKEYDKLDTLDGTSGWEIDLSQSLENIIKDMSASFDSYQYGIEGENIYLIGGNSEGIHWSPDYNEILIKGAKIIKIIARNK